MTSMIIWMLGIGFSVATLVISAAVKYHYVHMAVAALISILVALASFTEIRSEVAADSKPGAGVASSLRHMGMVWVWGALALLVTYAFDILQWREWWQFFMGFFLLAGLSLFLAATLQKDHDNDTADPTMTNIARMFAIGMLVVMVAVMIGMLIDGKMWRFNTAAGQRPGSQDWAANNIFFFGALALSAISWNAISLLGWRQNETA